MEAGSISARRSVAALAALLSRWQIAFVAALAACAAVFALNAALGVVSPSSAWGIGYGIAATLLMAGAALYGARRRTMRLVLGRTRTWQQFHVYGGMLFMLLVLMHAGFRFPEKGMTAALLVLSAWVSISGALGWLLQGWIPRVLTNQLSIEVVYERIPELTAQLREQAEKLVADAPDMVQDFHRRSIAPDMARRGWRLRHLIDLTPGLQSRAAEFDFVEGFLGAPDKEKLRSLERAHRTKLELDAHYSLQTTLRVWLWAHVPPSIALVVLVGIHIFSVWYY